MDNSASDRSLAMYWLRMTPGSVQVVVASAPAAALGGGNKACPPQGVVLDQFVGEIVNIVRCSI